MSTSCFFFKKVRRTRLGCQFVREKLFVHLFVRIYPSRFFFWREDLFSEPLLVDKMLTGVCQSTTGIGIDRQFVVIHYPSRLFSHGRICFRSHFWWTRCWHYVVQWKELLRTVSLFVRNCPSRFFSDGRIWLWCQFWWTRCWQSKLPNGKNACWWSICSWEIGVLFNDKNGYWQSICSWEIVQKLSIALLFWLETLFLKSLLMDKMLIGTLDSTIRTAIGGQFVREKLSIAFLFWRENLFSKALLVDMMLTGSCHSTIRAVFACQIVLEKLSIALLFWRKTVFHVTSGGQDVDGEVVFHGKICYWQSICSRDINRPFVCNCPLRASFLSGELVLEVFFGEPDVDRSEFVNDNNCWYYSSHFFSMDGIYFRSYFRRNRCWLRSVCISTSLFFTSLIDWIFFCSIYYYDKKIILTSETYYKNQETSKSKW